MYSFDQIFRHVNLISKESLKRLYQRSVAFSKASAALQRLARTAATTVAGPEVVGSHPDPALGSIVGATRCQAIRTARSRPR